MAEEKETPETEEEETKVSPADSLKEQVKKKSSIIIIAVLVVVGLILAGVISFFVTTKLVANSGGGNVGSAGGMAQNHDPGVFIKLGDEKEGLIVNVGGIKGGHFLKVGLVLEINPGKKDIVDKGGKLNTMAETKMLDTTLHILRSEKIDNFDASKQDALKKKLKEELNKVLGDGSIYSVYITSFVLQ